MRLSKSLRGLFASLPPLQVKVCQSKTCFNMLATISSSQDGFQRACDNIVQSSRAPTCLRQCSPSKTGFNMFAPWLSKQDGFTFAPRLSKQDGFPFDTRSAKHNGFTRVGISDDLNAGTDGYSNTVLPKYNRFPFAMPMLWASIACHVKEVETKSHFT